MESGGDNAESQDVNSTSDLARGRIVLVLVCCPRCSVEGAGFKLVSL